MLYCLRNANDERPISSINDHCMLQDMLTDDISES